MEEAWLLLIMWICPWKYLFLSLQFLVPFWTFLSSFCLDSLSPGFFFTPSFSLLQTHLPATFPFWHLHQHLFILFILIYFTVLFISLLPSSLFFPFLFSSSTYLLFLCPLFLYPFISTSSIPFHLSQIFNLSFYCFFHPFLFSVVFLFSLLLLVNSLLVFPLPERLLSCWR